MIARYDTRSVEIFVDGEKVEHGGAVVVVYDAPKPTIAEYLARREYALDANALRVSSGQWGYRRAEIVWHESQWWREYRDQVPPRDKQPLPLP